MKLLLIFKLDQTEPLMWSSNRCSAPSTIGAPMLTWHRMVYICETVHEIKFQLALLENEGKKHIISHEYSRERTRY
jgi:hypothetical protein